MANLKFVGLVAIGCLVALVGYSVYNDRKNKSAE